MVTGNFTHRYHANPRLSANQLGDYLTATASSRKRILQDAKFPPTMLVVRYEDARRALRSHLQAGALAANTLEKAIAILGRRLENSGLTEWKKKSHRLCIEAIETFQAFEEEIGLGGIKYTAPDNVTSKINISGVSISVSLDLVARRTDAKGVKFVGGVIFVFSKTGGADKNAASRCEAIALLIRELVSRNVKPGMTCDPSLCMAVDVFAGKVYRAKDRQKKFLNSVESSCEEVAVVWPKVKAPEDYYGPPISAA